MVRSEARTLHRLFHAKADHAAETEGWPTNQADKARRGSCGIAGLSTIASMSTRVPECHCTLKDTRSPPESR